MGGKSVPFIHHSSTSALPQRSQQCRRPGSPPVPSVQDGSVHETPSTQEPSRYATGEIPQFVPATASCGPACPASSGNGSCACAARGRLSTTAATSRIELDFMGKLTCVEK